MTFTDITVAEGFLLFCFLTIFILMVQDLIKNKFQWHKLFMDENGEPQMVSFLALATFALFTLKVLEAEIKPDTMYLFLIGILGSLSFFPQLTREILERAAKSKLKIQEKLKKDEK